MNYKNNIIKVLRADKLEFDARPQIAKIFADGFSQWLVYFSKDHNIIEKAFAHMFVLDQFYVAFCDNTIMGVAACTDCRSLSVKLNKKELKKHLGFIKGNMAILFLKKEFEREFENPLPNTGSIEFVGTSSEFRGRGIATLIIQYIIDNTPYNDYLIDEVADTNVAAMSLYTKLGFKECKRIPIPLKRAKKIGINNFISLKYSKDYNN